MYSPERFLIIFFAGAFTLADLISGVIPLITLCKKSKNNKLKRIHILHYTILLVYISINPDF